MILCNQRDPLLFQEFHFESTYVSGSAQGDQLPHKVAVTTEDEPNTNNACLWFNASSDKHLYETAAQFLDEKQENEYQ